MADDQSSQLLTASNGRIMVLLWADILANYAMFILMEYLTNVWKLNFTDAGAIVNIYTGVSAIMPIGIAFLVDTLFGNYWMLFLSSWSYAIGLGLLSMSTPPVLSKATGTCSSYEQECIGHVQKALLYTSLPLIAIGIGGHTVSLNAFIDEQASVNERERIEGVRSYKYVGYAAIFIVPLVSAIALPYIKPWSVRFGIPAICTLVATVAFMSKSRKYNCEKPKGSPYTRMFRVFIASACKMRLPVDDSKLYWGRDQDSMPRPHPSRFRCLDKAALIAPNEALEEQEKNRWKLCKVTDVDETKIALRLIPMSMTFIVVGLVTSIANTYFVEQANHMNPKVGKLKVPLPILLWFYMTATTQSTGLYNKMEEALSSIKKYVPAIGFGVGMFFSILCCITAALVEKRRIGVIKDHDLVHKPDETIPMSMFWLLPQFLFLGALDGLAHTSVSRFFRDQVPASWKQSTEAAEGSNTNNNNQAERNEEGDPLLRSHMMIFTNGVFGAGKVSAVLSVYLVGYISKKGGKPGWFQDTLNMSRLDYYYWTLAVLSSVGLLLFVVLAARYKYVESAEAEEEQPGENDNSECYQVLCCCGCF
ncbi:hypothetical protein Syun_016718 [Stephania yunnanensis]|uniref:Uncharacterized protein n=1 Tax=Stephania yunnanensis TaxID=152371 RepID=A0AAP0J7Y8_9MAGN